VIASAPPFPSKHSHPEKVTPAIVTGVPDFTVLVMTAPLPDLRVIDVKDVTGSPANVSTALSPQLINGASPKAMSRTVVDVNVVVPAWRTNRATVKAASSSELMSHVIKERETAALVMTNSEDPV
jgi:hypothetical protein